MHRTELFSRGLDKKNKQYNSYLALTINKDNLASHLSSKLSSEDKKELDMDYNKFRELLDKETSTDEN